MTFATLAQVLQPALAQSYAVAGLVCLGCEDMRAYVTAARAVTRAFGATDVKAALVVVIEKSHDELPVDSAGGPGVINIKTRYGCAHLIPTRCSTPELRIG